MVLKHHNYVVDPKNSLQAPEPKTRYPGQCWQDLSIISHLVQNKYTYKKTTWPKRWPKKKTFDKSIEEKKTKK